MAKKEFDRPQRLIVFIILLLFCVTASMYFFRKKGVAIKNETSSLPDKWSYIQSHKCNVNIPLPPAETPYINNEYKTKYFWQFQETEGGILLFESTAKTFLTFEGKSNGSSLGEVTIFCSPNSNHYTTDTLVSSIESLMENLKNDAQACGYCLDNPRISEKKPTTLWHRDVMIVTIDDLIYISGDFYVFATKNTIYAIRKNAPPLAGPDKAVDIIFNDLQFIEN